MRFQQQGEQEKELFIGSEEDNVPQRKFSSEGKGAEMVSNFQTLYAQMHERALTEEVKIYFLLSNNFVSMWKAHCLSKDYEKQSKQIFFENNIFTEYGKLKTNIYYPLHYQILDQTTYNLLKPYVNSQHKNQRFLKWEKNQKNQNRPVFFVQCNYLLINSQVFRKIDCGYLDASQLQYQTILVEQNAAFIQMKRQIAQKQSIDLKKVFLEFWHLQNDDELDKIFQFIKKALSGLFFEEYKILNIGKQLKNLNVSLSEISLMDQKIFFLVEEFHSNPVFIQNFDGICRGCNTNKQLMIQCPCGKIRYCSNQCLKKHEENHKRSCSYFEQMEFNKPIHMRIGPQSAYGRAGLRNIGNTCYMNSCLQCLSNTISLTNYFYKGYFQSEINKKNPNGTKGRLSKTYAKFINAIWCGQHIQFQPRALKQYVGKINPTFSGNMQQDAQQFFAFLIDGLHEDLNRVQKKINIQIQNQQTKTDQQLAKLSWTKYIARGQSLITDLMTGQFCSSLKCLTCDKRSVNFDIFNTVPLPIPTEKTVRFFMIYQNQHKKNMKRFLTYLTTNPYDWVKKACEVGEVKNPQRWSLYVVTERENIYKVGRETMDDIVYKIQNDNKNLFLIQKTDDEISIPKDLAFQMTVNLFQPDNPDKKQLFFKFPMLFNKHTANRLEITKRVLKFIYSQAYREGASKMTRSYEDPTKFIGSPKYEEYEKTMVKNKIFRVFLKYQKRTSIQKSSRKPEVKFLQEKQIDRTNLLLYGLIMEKGLKPRDCEIQIRFEGPQKTKDFNFNFMKRFDEINDSKSVPLSSVDPIIPLENCFKAFQEADLLMGDNSWYCPNCNKPQQALKEMKIYRAPRILVIQLKRFKQRGWEKNKITLEVDFPFELDLSQYVIDPKPVEAYRFEGIDQYIAPKQKILDEIGVNQNSKPDYELYGVINHMGDLGGGHYTAYAKNYEKWIYYNDTEFKEIQDLEVDQTVKSKYAYLLFYKRKSKNIFDNELIL